MGKRYLTVADCETRLMIGRKSKVEIRGAVVSYLICHLQAII